MEVLIAINYILLQRVIRNIMGWIFVILFPVTKITTVRCLLSVSAIYHWPLYQMDVKNAFLQGDLDEEIYMFLPLGFRSQGKIQEGLRNKGELGNRNLSRLMKSLYGLKLSL